MKTHIHVNKHVLARNRKAGLNDPPITVKTYKSNLYCQEVELSGTWRIMHRKDKPLDCGAVVYLEGDSENLKIIS